MGKYNAIKPKILLFFSVTMLLALIILGFTYQRNVLASPKPTPTFYDPNSDLIKGLEENLKMPNIPAKEQKLLEGKLQNLLIEATRRVRAYQEEPTDSNPNGMSAGANSNRDPSTFPTLPGIPTPDRSIRLRGIEDHPTTNFYNIENGWQDQINGVWVMVFAGSDPKDPQQGRLIIWPDHSKTETVKTPLKAGAVRITAVSNFQLTLQSKDGSVFYFDIPGRTFINALGDVVVTVTPGPTLVQPAYMNTATPNPGIPNQIISTPAYP
jgi:hypothetical protein